MQIKHQIKFFMYQISCIVSDIAVLFGIFNGGNTTIETQIPSFHC